MFGVFKNIKQKIEIIRWLHSSKPRTFIGEKKEGSILDDYIAGMNRKQIEDLLASLRKDMD